MCISYGFRHIYEKKELSGIIYGAVLKHKRGKKKEREKQKLKQTKSEWVPVDL